MQKPSLDGLIKASQIINILDQGTGEKAPWKLYSHQIKVLSTLLQHDRTVWLKARQLGISTLMTYYVLMLGVLNNNIRVGVVADNFSNSIGLLEKIKEFCIQLGITLQIDNQKRIL